MNIPENEDAIMSYRRLCEAIATYPGAWDNLLNAVEDRFCRTHRNSSDKLIFRRNRASFQKICMDIAVDEKLYWATK
jgi:hypothetical protein